MGSCIVLIPYPKLVPRAFYLHDRMIIFVAFAFSFVSVYFVGVNNKLEIFNASPTLLACKVFIMKAPS